MAFSEKSLSFFVESKKVENENCCACWEPFSGAEAEPTAAGMLICVLILR